MVLFSSLSEQINFFNKPLKYYLRILLQLNNHSSHQLKNIIIKMQAQVNLLTTLKKKQLQKQEMLNIKKEHLFLVNNTFVFCSFVRSGFMLRHVDAKGKKIGDLEIEDQIKECAVVGGQLFIGTFMSKMEYQTIVLLQWNLKTHKSSFIKHKLTHKYISTYIFPQSRLTCILQEQDKENNVFKFTFYKDNPNQNMYGVCSFTQTFEQQNNKKILIRRLNNYSMIGFFWQESISRNWVRFVTVFINQQFKVQKRSYSFEYELNPLNSEDLSVMVKDAWEVGLGQFYVQIQVLVDLKKICYDLIKNPQELKPQDDVGVFYNHKNIKQRVGTLEPFEKYHNILWNANGQTFQTFPFTKDHRHRIQFINDLRQVNQYQKPLKKLQQRIIFINFKTSKYPQNNVQIPNPDQYNEQRIPIYYISPKTLHIVCQQHLNPGYKYHMSWSNPNSKMFIIQKQSISAFNNINLYVYKVEQVSVPFQVEYGLLTVFLLGALGVEDQRLVECIVRMVEDDQ